MRYLFVEVYFNYAKSRRATSECIGVCVYVSECVTGISGQSHRFIDLGNDPCCDPVCPCPPPNLSQLCSDSIICYVTLALLAL